MRILHVITRFLGGGAEEKTLLEIEGLSRDHEYALASGPEFAPQFLSRLQARSVPHHVIPALRHYAPFRAPAAIRQLRKLIRSGGYDVVHTHSTEAGLLGREAAKRERIPGIVHTIHGLEFSRAHPWPIRRAVIAFHRRLAPHTHRYFSNARVLTDAFLRARIGTSDQFRLVRSGVDLMALAAATRGTLEGQPALLTACRLESNKGVAEVIKALPRLVKRSPDLILSVAGDGPDRSHLEGLAAATGVSSNVRFLGYRSDLPALLKAADGFLLASHREGTPRVITQALAVGCPIVATAVDGIPEQVEHGRTGLLVAPRDPSSIAQALERLLDDRSATRQRARAGQNAIQEFSLERMVSTLRDEYASLERATASKR